MLAIDRCDRCAAQAYVRVQMPIPCSWAWKWWLAEAILIIDDRPKLVEA